MNRRQFLTVAATTTTGLAGCLSGGDPLPSVSVTEVALRTTSDTLVADVTVTGDTDKAVLFEVTFLENGQERGPNIDDSNELDHLPVLKGISGERTVSFTWTPCDGKQQLLADVEGVAVSPEKPEFEEQGFSDLAERTDGRYTGC